MHETTALLAASLGLVALAVALVAAVWAGREHRSVPPAPGGLRPAAFRYCPAELRTRAATPHPDGSATCDGCGAHIPAPEAVPGA